MSGVASFAETVEDVCDGLSEEARMFFLGFLASLLDRQGGVVSREEFRDAFDLAEQYQERTEQALAAYEGGAGRGEDVVL